MGECDMYERGGRGGCGDDNVRWRGTKKGVCIQIKQELKDMVLCGLVQLSSSRQVVGGLESGEKELF